MQCGGESAEGCAVVVGVVRAWRAVQAIVVQTLPTAGGGSERRAGGRIGGNAGDVEIAQKAIGFWSEPACVARLAGGEAGVEFTQRREKFVRDAGIKGEFGWKLYEDWAKFFAEPVALFDERLQKRTTVDELCGVRDGFRNLDGELEIRWCAGGPAFPGFAHVGAVKAGIDFDTVENC